MGDVPSFNASVLSGEFQAMTGGGDATKGLTFDFCASVIEGTVGDPNFEGMNDDDVRRILGMEAFALNNQLAAQNALLAEAIYDLTKILNLYPPSKTAAFASLIQDAKTNINALNPGKFLF